MSQLSVFQTLVEEGIVPVIRTDDPDDVFGAVDALAAGGIQVAEITMTIPDAIGIIQILSAERGDEILIGAGTITDADSLDRAVATGSRFVVTPVCDVDLVEKGVESGVCVIGGALTPTEVLANWRAGAMAVKVFPASLLGPKYLRMLAEPFPDIPLVPTGGISLDNIIQYLEAGAAFVGVGGDLVSRSALRDGDYKRITLRASEYIRAVQSARRPKG